MILSHKIHLEPTIRQRRYFAMAAGTDRFVWNYALAEWNRQYEAGLKPNAYDMKIQFNKIKYEKFPWLHDIHRDAHADPFLKLGEAFGKFFKHKAGRPKFHKKGRKDSFYVANDAMKIAGNKIRLPKIGWIKMSERLRFDGKIMSATVSRTADRWFVAIQVEVGECHKPRTGEGKIGIDLGLTSWLTLSTGEKIPAPKSYAKNLDKLRRYSRLVSRKQKGSNNRRKSTDRLARLHARIANIRRDAIHKTTTRLCRENQAIAIEDLAVKNMVRNRSLARSIADAGWSEIRRQLTYKSEIYQGKLVVIDRWFPSSKMCRKCDAINENLTLRNRTFSCEACGHSEDRDVHAANNICTVGLTGIYAWGVEGSGCKTDIATKPCHKEPRTKTCPLVGTG